MRFERERSPRGNRWSFQTTAAVDRAVATLLIGAGAALAHLLGIGVP
jgi:hypothetical protein